MVSGVSSMLGSSYVDLSAMRQAMFQKADADSSGGLSLEEFQAVGPKDGQAPQGAPSVSDIFASIDTDSDGSVTQTELDAQAKADFTSRLQQGGMLSGSNMLQASQSSAAQDFLSNAASDGNGVLSLDEFEAAKPEDAPDDVSSSDIFARLDADSDGSLTASELQAGQPQGGPGGAGGPPPGGPPPGGPPPGGSSASSEDDDSTSTLLDYLSSNSDDTSDLFSFMDSDSDGSVSSDELQTGMASLRSQMMDYLINQQAA